MIGALRRRGLVAAVGLVAIARVRTDAGCAGSTASDVPAVEEEPTATIVMGTRCATRSASRGRRWVKRATSAGATQAGAIGAAGGLPAAMVALAVGS